MIAGEDGRDRRSLMELTGQFQSGVIAFSDIFGDGKAQTGPTRFLGT